MKSYLDLVPISAKVRRRQSRMSVACIVLAVFLVTAIFGMADMYIRSQISQVEQDNGIFHVGIVGITDEEAALIADRPDVAATARYGVIPYEEDAPYTLFGRSILIAGCDETMMVDIIPDAIVEGHFPQAENAVMLTQNARDVYGLQIGDAVTIDAPDGRTLTYTISGFVSDSAQTMSSDGMAAFLTTPAFRAALAEARGQDDQSLENVNLDDVNSGLYVQLAHPFFARQAIADLKTDLGLDDDQVVENIKLLGLYGQSSNSQLVQIYITAVVLGVLVLIAGILMITSSLNSNVAQRTEFYGMMRCLGATPKQVMRLVRREALRWCRLAIPLGVAIGVVLVWALCALLRHLSPDYFAEMPAFGVSLPSIAAGVVLGFLTVFLAARAGQTGGESVAAGRCQWQCQRSVAGEACLFDTPPAGGNGPRHPPRQSQQEKSSAYERLLRFQHHSVSLFFCGCRHDADVVDAAQAVDLGRFRCFQDQHL